MADCRHAVAPRQHLVTGDGANQVRRAQDRAAKRMIAVGGLLHQIEHQIVGLVMGGMAAWLCGDR